MFCYKYGHNWEGRYFQECSRCGLSKNDIFRYAFFLAIVTLPYFVLRQWYRNWRGDTDAR